MVVSRCKVYNRLYCRIQQFNNENTSGCKKKQPLPFVGEWQKKQTTVAITARQLSWRKAASVDRVQRKPLIEYEKAIRILLIPVFLTGFCSVF